MQGCENGPASGPCEVSTHIDVRYLLFIVFRSTDTLQDPQRCEATVIACREVRGLASKRGLCRPRLSRWQKLKPDTSQATTMNRLYIEAARAKNKKDHKRLILVLLQLGNDLKVFYI
jgi:hypothetical protein